MTFPISSSVLEFVASKLQVRNEVKQCQTENGSHFRAPFYQAPGETTCFTLRDLSFLAVNILYEKVTSPSMTATLPIHRRVTPDTKEGKVIGFKKASPYYQTN